MITSHGAPERPHEKDGAQQDPEDIYAIIEKTALPYERYKAIVADMLPDYIGNPRALLLSAMIVVETMYPKHRTDFESLLK